MGVGYVGAIGTEAGIYDRCDVIVGGEDKVAYPATVEALLKEIDGSSLDGWHGEHEDRGVRHEVAHSTIEILKGDIAMGVERKDAVASLLDGARELVVYATGRNKMEIYIHSGIYDLGIYEG